MSTLNFPSNPILNQEYDYPPYKYYWDGMKWKTKSIGYNPVNELRNEVVGSTREAIRRSYQEAGYNLVDGSFELGGTLHSPSDVILHQLSGKAYTWEGTYPDSGYKVVAGTAPTAGSGFVIRSDASLRGELAGSNGAALSLSQIATTYGLDLSSGGAWTNGEIISVGQWRYYNNKIWEPNVDSTTCGAAPDFASFHTVVTWTAPDEIALSSFGVTVDGGDVTTQLSRAINFAKYHSQWLTVVDDIIGTKYVSAALPQMNSSFSAVRLRSINRKLCVLKFDGNGSTIGAAPNGAISYLGGSGQLFGRGIWDITLDGGSTVSPLLVKGFCGLVVENCRYVANVAAVLSNDIGTGTFTEFFNFSNCDIRCNKIFTMKRGAGNDSFHGCGWDDLCIINIGNVTSIIDIGEGDGANRIVWYNAPVGGSIFNHAGPDREFVKYLNSASANNVVSIVGNMRFENTVSVKISASSRVFVCGNLTAIGGRLIFGSALPCDMFDLNDAGSPVFNTKPIRKKFTKAAGTQTVDIGGDSGLGSLYFVSCTAPNYEYQQLIFVVGEISQWITKTATVLQTGRSFNDAGYGAPVPQWSGNKLQLTNANWTSASVTVRVQTLSTSTYDGDTDEW